MITLLIATAWAMAAAYAWHLPWHRHRPHPPVEALLGYGPAAIDGDGLFTDDDWEQLANMLEDF